MNLYQYVGSNPAKHRDPSGLFYREFMRLNSDERMLVTIWPVSACKSQGCRGVAFAAARNSGLPGPHNGPQDALRHCVWICCMTQRSDMTFALAMGIAHEKTSTSKDEKAMDIHNNIAGAVAGGRGGNCTTACNDARTGGRLRVLRQTGSGPVPAGTPLHPSQ